MEIFADLPVFAEKEDFAECVAIRGEDLASVLRDGKELRAGKFHGCGLMVGTAEEAPNPSLGTTVNLLSVGSDDHLPCWIERVDAGKMLFRIARLIGDECDSESAWLAVHPFMEGAAHSAAPIVVNFDRLNRVGESHGFPFVIFSNN